MNFKEENTQRKEFKQILLDLAKEQNVLENPSCRVEFYKRLEELYYSENPKDGFRHFYSDIFEVLTQIKQTDEPGDIETLGQNLQEIRKGYQPKNNDENGDLIDVSERIKKLYDHVSLDIARITYSAKGDAEVLNKDSIQEIKTQLTIISQKADKLEGKTQNIQREYITILGIFASIILAFMGGISFSSSVLANMNNGNLFRVIVVIDLLAFVLINTIYMLTKFISKINDKDIKLPIRAVNITCLAVLIITGIGWVFSTNELQIWLSEFLFWTKK